MLLTAKQTDLDPYTFVTRHAQIFAMFDAASQDSGNVSYGVQAGDDRLFIKTAGLPQDSQPLLSHAERVALLRNAIRLARSVSDPALPALRNVVESVEGPLLVYEWLDGELIGTSVERRSDPTSPFARFLALDLRERTAALDAIFRLHVNLANAGWVACDFYDGSLMYDFARRQMHVVDLDNYRDAPFTNEMGRMFGSSRFMAPEEYELGARIDERTTVFVMGRTVEQFLSSRDDGIATLVARACRADRRLRFQSVTQFYDAWTRL